MKKKSVKKQLLAAIQPEIEAIEYSMRQDLQSHADQIAPLLNEVLEYGLFNGGKRIRPLLVVLAARICGNGNNGKSIYRLASAFEYLHAATLFHDDVIDKALERRGRPAVNCVFGNVAAILGGDYLHARSMALVGEYGGKRGLKMFTAATTAMVDGEFLQLHNASNLNQSEEDYFAVVRGKTALLIAATCEIGATFGGGDSTQQKALRDYGLNLGCAFQIVDDILDYHGDSKKTGKAVGNDFKEGKMTLPLITCLERANENDKAYLLSLLELSQEDRKASFAEALTLIQRYGCISYCREMAEKSIKRSLNSIDVFSSNSTKTEKNILKTLAAYVLSREK